MRQFLILFLLAVSLTAPAVSPVHVGSSGECQSRIIANTSVKTSIPAYRQTYWRDKNEYFEILGEAYKKEFQNHLYAGSGRRFLDLGAGFSLPGIAWAQDGGRAVAVSAHDFWREIEQFTELDATGLTFHGYGGEFKLDMAGGIDGVGLRAAARVMGIAYDEQVPLRSLPLLTFVRRPDGESYLPTLQKLGERLSRKRLELEKTGNFLRQTGMAEEILPRFHNKVDLLADVYGAFFYSVDRRHVVELVYQSLRPNGAAYLLYGRKQPSRYGGPYDTVLRSGVEVDFLDFLVGAYPTVFSEVDAQDYRVLRIQRDPLLPRISLKLALLTQNISYVSSSDGYSFAQKVLYTESP